MQCIDDRESGCRGEVNEYLTLSGSGMTFPRCEKHYGEYVDRVQPQMDAINRRYPKQAPSWFDPTYAGESWDEDY